MSSKIEVSFVIQYFNHRDNIIPIVESIIGLWDGNEEIIFHNDSNSDHDIFEKLCNRKPKLNEKIRCIVSDNIHEIRGYNKCIPECKGEYIFLMQDDDIFTNKTWTDNIKYLFNRFNKSMHSGLDQSLGIISLHNGGMRRWNSEEKLEYKIYNAKNYEGYPSNINYKKNGIKFQFVSWANLAPMIVRKEVFNKVGLFNESYSEKGESGIGLDTELSFRANLSNFLVGVMYFCDIDRGVGGHGTLIGSKAKQRKRNLRKNQESFNRKYSSYFDKIYNKVCRYNEELLNKR